MSDKIVNLKEYRDQRDVSDLAKRVADLCATLDLMQGEMPIYLINEEGELVELGGERDPEIPELEVPPHLSLVDDPDDCV